MMITLILLSLMMMMNINMYVKIRMILCFRNKKEPISVYKRLSAHITLDLPDLPELSDALRETANKVESIMHQARSTSQPPESSSP